MRHILWQEIQVSGCSFHISQVRYRPGERFVLHDHDFSEVMMVETGQGWHLVNGERHVLEPGSLCFIRPEDCHALLAGDAGLLLHNCAFPASHGLDLEVRYFEGEHRFFQHGGARLRHECLKGQPFATAVSQFQKTLGQTHSLLHLDCLLTVLFTLVIDSLGSPGNRGAPDWLTRAWVQMREPENLALGLKRFFDLTARSDEHASRETKKFWGQTPTDVLQGLRLEASTKLLSTTDLSCLDVALACGYENLSWFHRSFKDRYAVTPLQYRKRSLYDAN